MTMSDAAVATEAPAIAPAAAPVESKSVTKKVHAIVITGDADPKKKVKDVVAKAADVEMEDGDSRLQAWEELYKSNKVIEPPFELFSLTTMSERNSELSQCIDAMEINIVGFGYQLKPFAMPEIAGSQDDGEPDEVLEERARIQEFLDYGNYEDTSFTFVRRQQRRDLESTGMRYLEIITTKAGAIVGYRHVPAYQMRLAPVDDEFTAYQQPRLIGIGADRHLKMVARRKRFRRYVQLQRSGLSGGLRQVWFKELSDPRIISSDDGTVKDQEWASKNPGKVATSMLYKRLYSARTPYGVPRWIGNLLAILGSRASEEINYTTFKNNNVPSMMIMVSNGQLTGGTIGRINEFVKSVIQGSDNYSKFLVIEAEPDGSDADGGHVKIEVKELGQVQHSDAMFQAYDKANTDKVRRAFRLPPIFVGISVDYNRATAEAARRLGDEQVFNPERQEEDHGWNDLLRCMGMKFHEFKSNTPNITDDEDIIKVMQAAERSGAITPRIAKRMVEDIMGHELAAIDPSVKPDVPFSLQMAEAVKNMADPKEVGQQVTAVKSINTTPPVEVVNVAKKALDQVSELKRGGTTVSRSVAKALVSGKPLSVELVAKVAGFMSRHSEPQADATSNEAITWGLWGGTPAAVWVKKVMEQVGVVPVAKADVTGGAVVARERALKAGAVPAFVLEPSVADSIVSGTETEFHANVFVETQDRAFFLSDGTHLLGMVEVEPGEPGDGTWLYKVNEVLAFAATPHPFTGVSAPGYTDSLRMA
jgi:PBSX family phage portal protein